MCTVLLKLPFLKLPFLVGCSLVERVRIELNTGEGGFGVVGTG